MQTTADLRLAGASVSTQTTRMFFSSAAPPLLPFSYQPRHLQGRLHPAVTDENPDIEIDIEIKVLLLPGRWSAQKPAFVHSGEVAGFPRVQSLETVLPNRKLGERWKIELPVAFDVMDFSAEMEVRPQNYVRRYVADSLEGATV